MNHSTIGVVPLRDCICRDTVEVRPTEEIDDMTTCLTYPTDHLALYDLFFHGLPELEPTVLAS